MVITKSFLSGSLFTLFGAGTVLMAQNYAMGTAGRMGPGYFPTLVGALIILLGVAQIIRAILSPNKSEPIAEWELRPLFFLLTAVVVFAVTMSKFGLIPAVVALIVIARLAAREGNLLELAAMVAALTAGAVLVFVYLLNIPLKLGI